MYRQRQRNVQINTAQPLLRWALEAAVPGGIANRAQATPQSSWPGTCDHRALTIEPFPTQEPPHCQVLAALPFPHPQSSAFVSTAALDYVSHSDFNSSDSAKPSQILPPTIPDLISSSTCHIRFNASPLCLLTLPSLQDLPPLPGSAAHPEQNSSPGGSCKLCCASEILQYSSQKNSMF